jgi:hypothetical protein
MKMPVEITDGSELSRRYNAVVKSSVFNDLWYAPHRCRRRIRAWRESPASQQSVRKRVLFVIFSIDSIPIARIRPRPWSSSPKKPSR